jgi:hypothetical protein
MAVAYPPSLHVRRKFPIIRLVLAFSVVAFLVAVIVLARHWPFTESAIIRSLEQASSSKVEIGKFRKTYFPYPGCVAQQVIVRREPGQDTPPLIAVQTLTIQGSYLGLITKHVTRVRTEGLRIFIPSQPSNQKFRSSSDVMIDEWIADDAMLEFGSRVPGKAPLKFAIHQCVLRGVGGALPVTFRVKLSNPEPPGEITAQGKIGPWRVGNATETPVSGDYLFEHANLGVFGGIAGLLSSTGKFDGPLGRIRVHGTTDTPDFKVTHSSHRVDLKTQFNAFVNAKTGNVELDQVDASLWRTNVISTGSIARKGNVRARVTELDMRSREGRIEDILNLFISDNKPPMTGVTSFRAHVMLPAGNVSFLKKVELEGDFGVDAGNFTKPQTQEEVNKLSAEATSENDRNPATVVSDLKGHVMLKDGRAHFTYLSFTVPGAFAIMQGTYDLVSEKIDLHGVLRLNSPMSNLAHGPRALLLKALQPFFKRKSKGSKVAVKITGTYGHPLFGVDLTGQKENATTRRLRRLYRKPTK